MNTTSATYDALGRMVEKGLSGTYTQFVFRPSGAILAVYSGSLVKGTVPLPGGSTAIYNASGLSYIRHKDWLGSSRLATTWAHAVYSKEAYAPFGETYNEAGTADRSFTGQDQDVVTGSGGSGVYDFLFRKYDPSAGRWLSPDPYGWRAVKLRRPQSLNRYAYAQNNPLALTDPMGLSCIWLTDGNGVSVEADDGDGLGCAAAGIAPGDPDSGTTDQDPDTVNVDGGDNDPDPEPDSDDDDASLSIPMEPLWLFPGGSAPSNATIGPANPNSKPNVPPDPAFCGGYRDGTGAGDILYNLCMNFPNNPWSNCVRGKLLNQYTRNGNPVDLSIYLFWDHPADFASCAAH